MDSERHAASELALAIDRVIRRLEAGSDGDPRAAPQHLSARPGITNVLLRTRRETLEDAPQVEHQIAPTGRRLTLVCGRLQGYLSATTGTLRVIPRTLSSPSRIVTRPASSPDHSKSR